jgi:cation diffusion facilitator family transporter
MSGALAGAQGRSAAIRRVFLGLLAANLAVVGAKVAIGLTTGSLAVLGDAVHSSVDAVNNVLFMALMRVAGRAPDEDHPYGHTKFEVLGAIGIVIFLSVACFELLKSAIAGLVHRAPPPTFTDLDLALIASTLAVNVWVAWYEARKGRELGSDLLLADAAHTRADVFITLGVLGGAALSRNGVPYVDPVVAIIVTVLIARIGWEIVQRALPTLVDQVARAPEAIRRSAESVDGVRSAYAIRSRSASGVVFAELTIGVPGVLAVDRAHSIADAVELQLKRDLRLDEVVVHIEPC